MQSMAIRRKGLSLSLSLVCMSLYHNWDSIQSHRFGSNWPSFANVSETLNIGTATKKIKRNCVCKLDNDYDDDNNNDNHDNNYDDDNKDADDNNDNDGHDDDKDNYNDVDNDYNNDYNNDDNSSDEAEDW